MTLPNDPSKAEQYREKLRLAKLGNTLWLGCHHTPEAKARMRLAHLGVPLSEQHRQAMMGRTSWVGRHHAVESRKKMSQAHKGKKLSDEHREHMREAQQRRRQRERQAHEEYLKRIKARRRR